MLSGQNEINFGNEKGKDDWESPSIGRFSSMILHNSKKKPREKMCMWGLLTACLSNADHTLLAESILCLMLRHHRKVLKADSRHQLSSFKQDVICVPCFLGLWKCFRGSFVLLLSCLILFNVKKYPIECVCHNRLPHCLSKDILSFQFQAL